jgi:hypothetical protein
MTPGLTIQTTEERAASDARARRQALRQIGRAATGKLRSSAGSVVALPSTPRMRRIRHPRWSAMSGRAIFLASQGQRGLRHSAGEGP